jgi:hypothetical protein
MSMSLVTGDAGPNGLGLGECLRRSTIICMLMAYPV